MHNTERSVAISKELTIFKNLLLLYPDSYRKKFELEMLITFGDMYQEKKLRDGKIGFLFWLGISLDISKSACKQHGELLKKQGMKKYLFKTLHFNTCNIIGALLLLPFLSVFLIDVVARISQGDLTHYNRPVYTFLSHTFLYQKPVLLVWVILFPAIAVLINLIPLIQNSFKKHRSLFHLSFIKQNIITFSILAMGIGFLALLKLHDFAPCSFHGILRFGLQKLPFILSYCKNT